MDKEETQNLIDVMMNLIQREVKALEEISESLKSIELTLKRKEFLKK